MLSSPLHENGFSHRATQCEGRYDDEMSTEYRVSSIDLISLCSYLYVNSEAGAVLPWSRCCAVGSSWVCGVRACMMCGHVCLYISCEGWWRLLEGLEDCYTLILLCYHRPLFNFTWPYFILGEPSYVPILFLMNYNSRLLIVKPNLTYCSSCLDILCLPCCRGNPESLDPN